MEENEHMSSKFQAPLLYNAIGSLRKSHDLSPFCGAAALRKKGHKKGSLSLIERDKMAK